MHFVGRLATYKYYNMDQVVAQALATYARITGRKRAESTRAVLGVPAVPVPGELLVASSTGVAAARLAEGT